MESVPPDRIRNVALVGHGASGKTTLAEAMLHLAGVTDRIGRVEDGSTVCDTEPEEQKRRISVSLAVAPFMWKGYKVNLIDTPGWIDFAGEVASALRVADLAVFVISAVDGVQSQTENTWRLASELGIPRMVFINKLDRERASFERTLDELRQRFGAGVAPLELPIGDEGAFHGVADLLSDTAFFYDKSGSSTSGAIPDEMKELEHQVHDNLVEGIVVADDEQLERYLSGDVLSFEELEKTLAHGVLSASVFPVVCGSATKEVGIDRLCDFVCEIGPSPLDRPPVSVAAGDTAIEVAPDPKGDPLAFVFKTVADAYVGRISVFKVLSGTVKTDASMINPRTSTTERMHGMFTLRGKDHESIGEVVTGDIAAVPKLSATGTGDTLAPVGKPVVVPRIAFEEPVLATAIRAKSQADDDKLGTALHRLQEEDPTLGVVHEEETHQTLLRGNGETHLAITLERLHRKFGVEVTTGDVKVAYRETVTGVGEAEGRYKKQSGGHGQFGVASLRLEPLERGEGFQFVDAIVGGAIPRQFIPAVEKGVHETMLAGGVSGYPVVDVKATLFDGKAHAVDSSEMSFRAAGRLAFREAMAKASPVLLEPVSLVEVTVPAEFQGDVMGDLNSRRGKVQGSASSGEGWQVVFATVPTAEIGRYAVDLRSMTGGRGRFTVSHDHYEVLPQHLVAAVARDIKEES